MGSIVSWHIGRKNKRDLGSLPCLPLFFFLSFFFFLLLFPFSMWAGSSARPVPPWDPPGRAAANVLGLQVLPGTKLDCDLLPSRSASPALPALPCPGGGGPRAGVPNPAGEIGRLSNEPLVALKKPFCVTLD